VSLPPEEVARIVADANRGAKSAAVSALRVGDKQEMAALPASDLGHSSTEEKPISFPPVNPRDPVAMVERQTLEVLVQYPQAFNQGQLLRIANVGMAQPAYTAVLKALVAALTGTGETWLGRIQSVIPEQLQSLLLGLAAADLPVTSEEKILPYAQAVVSKALERALQIEKTEALARLRRTDSAIDPSGFQAIQQQLVQLERERRALMGD